MRCGVCQVGKERFVRAFSLLKVRQKLIREGLGRIVAVGSRGKVGWPKDVQEVEFPADSRVVWFTLGAIQILLILDSCAPLGKL